MLQGLPRILQTHFPRFHILALRIWRSSIIRYRFHRRRSSLKAMPASSIGTVEDDRVIIDRVVASYKKRTEQPSGQWKQIYLDRHRDIHEAFMANDNVRISDILRDPLSSDLMYGFDSMCKSLRKYGMRSEDRQAPALTLDALLSLTESIGARRVENPENYGPLANKISGDAVLSQLETALGIQIPMPNFYPSEFGLATRRGVMSYRVPQAIWQGWRASQLVLGIKKPRVLEIGGGLGRTALYAGCFGITDYTIVDIPVSSIAQGYFLGRALGPNAVRLHGETSAQDDSMAIKVMSPAHFLDGNDRYDLVINVDSLTEMDRKDAVAYWNAIQKRAAIFLSVNHEGNLFTVAELADESISIVRRTRNPSWMRRGYVEEVFEFSQEISFHVGTPFSPSDEASARGAGIGGT